MFDFSNQVVMITGAVGNLGRAAAHAFHAAGAKLLLLDRSSSRLEGIYTDIIGSPDLILANSVDLTDPDSIEAAVVGAIERFERIDVLVNTVGGYRAGKPLHEISLETWDLMHDVNARSVFLVSRAVIPHMLRAGSGKIVNVSARSGLAGKANMAAYSASKSAVIRLTESMAAELRKFGINVNCILPGTIDTPQNRGAMPDADHSRWVKPESLADTILFLCSYAARDVHGAALPVFGKG